MLRNVEGEVLSHWYELFENFSTSTQDFYASVEEAIRRHKIPDIVVSRVLFNEKGVWTAKREYLRIKRGRIVFDICSAPYGTSHFFSWWLAKVPARYGLLTVFGIVMALSPLWNIFINLVARHFQNDPFAGLFVISTLIFMEIPAILLFLGFAVERGWIGNEEWVLSVPIIGYLYALVFKPLTYYRLDTAYMFRDSIQAIVGEAVNGLREEKGLRHLEADELAPYISKEMMS